jgi:uncharacterized membrane protein (DUF4010 family)
VAAAVPLATQTLLQLGAAFACGAMIGLQRGWQQREAAAGTRVARVRTFTLLGAGGGLSALVGGLLGQAVTAVLVAALLAPLVLAYAWKENEKSVTNLVAEVLAVTLGLLAGLGQPALAVAAAAVTTMVLVARDHLHGALSRLDARDVQAFARYAVIVAAVLPFLPDRSFGPYGAWNPFQLWLVVVLVTGFSFAGYIANRWVGASKGTLATALIGGAYSSTAVTATLSRRLGAGESGPYAAGIALASAVMFVRVVLLVALLTPSTLPAFAMLIGPVALVALLAFWWLWRRRSPEGAGTTEQPGNPIELLPAFGFVAIVAAGAVVTRWAEARYGSQGIALSLFITGSFDVDAAIVTLSQLPGAAIARPLAAIALTGTIVANMALKIGVVLAYAGRRGWGAAGALAASTAVLLIGIGVAALRLT